jgi:hypothetical protein
MAGKRFLLLQNLRCSMAETSLFSPPEFPVPVACGGGLLDRNSREYRKKSRWGRLDCHRERVFSLFFP